MLIRQAAPRALLGVGMLGAIWLSVPLAAQPPPEKTTLTGRVTHRVTGAPVAGARVSLHRVREGDEAVGFEGGETATDEAGTYRFEGVEEGQYTLAVSAPGYLPTTRSVQVTLPPATEEVALVPFSRISGRILDRAGRPLVRAEVCLLVPQVMPAEGFNLPALLPFRTTTDAEGRYRLPPVAAGSAQCLAIVPSLGYGASARRAVPEGQEATDVDISLQEGLSLRVRVQEEGTGQPVPGQPVTAGFSLGPPDFGESWSISAYTLADGVCTFRGLPPGSYRIRLGERPEGMFIGPPPPGPPGEGVSLLLLPGQEVREKTMTLPKREGWDLTGRLFGPDGTSPVSDSPLRFWVLPPPEREAAPASLAAAKTPLGPLLTATDSQGEFRLRLAHAMTGLVLVHAPGRGYEVTDPVALRPEEGHNRLELSLQPLGRLEGEVRTASGDPLPGATLAVIPLQPKRLPPLEELPPLQTDLAGRFRRSDLIPGPYRVQIVEPSAELGPKPKTDLPSQTVAVEGDRTAEVVFTVEGGSVSIRILGPTP